MICSAAALYDYKATDDDELTLIKGDIVNVLSKQDDGWWNVVKQTGDNAGQQGLIPSNYVYVRVNVKDNFKANSAESSSLPSGWETAVDPESGEKYYYNKSTGQVQWSAPPALVPAAADAKRASQSKQNSYSDLAQPVQTNNFTDEKGSSYDQDPMQRAHHVSHIPRPQARSYAQPHYMEPIHHVGKIHQHVSSNASNQNQVRMFNSDIAEFRRLREDADAKLAQLRKVLSIQENLHLLETGTGSNNDRHAHSSDQNAVVEDLLGAGQHMIRNPSKPSADKRGALSPRNRPQVKGLRRDDASAGGKGPSYAGLKSANNSAHGSAGSSPPSLRLDPSSLKAIARIVDARLEQRDDVLLGKMKAIVETATSPNSSPQALRQQLIQYSNNASPGDQHIKLPIGGPQGMSHSRNNSNSKLGLATEYGSATSAANLSLRSVDAESSPIRPEKRSPSSSLLPGFDVGSGHKSKPSEARPAWALSYKPSAPHAVSHVVAHGGSPVGHSIDAGSANHADDPLRRVSLNVARYDTSDMNTGHAEGIRYPQCRSTVYPPSAVEGGAGISSDELVDSSAPTAGLSLNHVYAYSGDSSRHGGAISGKNIMFLDRKRIIFPAASLVVVMNMETQTQGFFSGHTDDVTCLTVHPDRTIAASGQIGKDGRILIWDSSSIEAGIRLYEAAVELLVMGGTRGVCGLNFTADGRFLVALGMDETHTMVVFDWAQSVMVASVRIGHGDVSQMGFNPFLYVSTAPHDELKLVTTPRDVQEKNDSCCYTLISCGGRQIKFWTLRRTLEHDPETAAEIPYKGKKVSVSNKKQMFSATYTLEGNAGVFPKLGTDVPDMLCFTCVYDSEGQVQGNGVSRTAPKSRIFTGTSTGAVYIWQHLEETSNKNSLTQYSWQPRGRLLSVVSDVHESPIVDIDYTGAFWFSQDVEENTNERLITCGKDGITNVWKMDRDAMAGVPIEHLSTANIGFAEAGLGAPRCVSWDLEGQTAVVGTIGNAIVVLHGDGMSIGDGPSADAGDPSLPAQVLVHPLLRGHRGKVLRVVAHPTELVFATISVDKTLRLWHAKDKVQIALTRLAEHVTALDFAPDGSTLAVGNDAGEILIVHCLALESRRAGAAPLAVEELGVGPALGAAGLHEKQWNVITRRHVAAKAGPAKGPGGDGTSAVPASNVLARKRSEVTEIKYSPDGKVLAVACRDNLIHLLSSANGYRRAAVCRGHSAYIKNLDFSVDGRVLRASDSVRELLFWEVASGKQIANAAFTRDVKWSTCKAALGWGVQGVFNGPAGVAVDGDINAVCCSHRGTLLVAGSSSNTVTSGVKLFRYPCVATAVPSLHGGHTAPVLDAAFLSNDNAIVTVSASDAAIFCWSVLHERSNA